jgi:hypothetical protein
MNPIEDENQRPGDPNWVTTNARVDERGRSVGIEGYCSKTSYRAGETVEFFVNSESRFAIDIYRMGFYGGAGARFIGRVNDRPGGRRDVPSEGDLQLRECGWPVSATFSIPNDCVSGVYLGKLTELEGASTQSYVIFVVRDSRTCDFLFKTSETTWAAYNGWPDECSLYEFHGPPQKIGYWGPDIQVSFDRPYALSRPWYAMSEPERRCGWMVGASQFLIFEYPLAYWMESRGYDVSYIGCLDLHDMSAVTLRQRAKALLSVGHDEYYSIPMHDNLQSAVDAADDIPERGLSVGFFCAGSLTGVIDLRSSVRDGRSNRIFKRVGRWGAIEQWLLDLQPEQAGFGTAFRDGGDLMGARLVDPAVGVGDWRCGDTRGPLASQFYSGTGLREGDRIRNILGHEFTGNPVGRAGLEILAAENLVGGQGRFIDNKATATIYPGPKNNVVFNASTMWWPQWLNASSSLPFPGDGFPRFEWMGSQISPESSDKQRVERMTMNLFDMFRG